MPDLLLRSLFDGSLARLNFSIFSLHFILMAGFVALPLILEQTLGVPRERHWMVYLPALVLSIVGMVPLMIVAERLGRLKQSFLFAVLLVFGAQFLLIGQSGAWAFYFGMWVFFVGFNYLEATLPSLVSKTVYAGGKGTALGVYSTFQFLGAFAGGAVGGAALQEWGISGVFLSCAALAVLWWISSMGMSAPRPLSNLVLQLSGNEADQLQRLQRLRDSVGVEDVMLLPEHGTVYLKVDDEIFDHEQVKDLTI